MCKEAYNYLRRNYENNYAPKLEPEPEPLDKNVRPPKKKMKKTAWSVFLDDSEEEDDLPLTELETVIRNQDTEVDAYLALPQVSRLASNGEETNILNWWKNHSGMFPNLSKMARQYLAMPASSAGVERLFSAAGRMHDSFRKSTKEATLQAQLCVYQNS